MANTLQIKRSTYNGTTAPGDSAVIAGEFAIAQGSKKLYIGRENNSGGTVEAYHLPLLTDLTVNTTSFAISDDSTNANDNSQTIVLASGIAGNGLSLTNHVLDVSVDSAQIVDASIDLAHMSVNSIDSDQYVDGSIDSAHIASGTIANDRLANPKWVVSATGSGSSDIALGGTATFTGVSNETAVTESAGTVTMGLATDVTIAGNLTVSGTTTTVNSTTVTIDDPIFTLGGDTAAGSNDSKDRGIEFQWHNGTAAKLGFFGMDESDGKFKFIPDATNTAEVFSGSVGSAIFNDISASTVSDATIDGGAF